MMNILKSIGGGLVNWAQAVMDAGQISSEIKRLSSLNDADLKKLGLSRSDIPSYVARNHAYI
ncbi:DUF1127 domain-containing protein [Qingshengfaniella alkalisoli]|uniref:DUF1127 domain-containing protein n=2 Tax=Qingshengfaniella alkalisoli TaxID=2599296 RepID=A0A5B8I6D8_9RHOB|nr:DUF1127 domain-containing protein [Qingshengfaniella alkalisoli]